jgi:hypothetical protein
VIDCWRILPAADLSDVVTYVALGAAMQSAASPAALLSP